MWPWPPSSGTGRSWTRSPSRSASPAWPAACSAKALDSRLSARLSPGAAAQRGRRGLAPGQRRAGRAGRRSDALGHRRRVDRAVDMAGQHAGVGPPHPVGADGRPTAVFDPGLHCRAAQRGDVRPQSFLVAVTGTGAAQRHVDRQPVAVGALHRIADGEIYAVSAAIVASGFFQLAAPSRPCAAWDIATFPIAASGTDDWPRSAGPCSP